MTIPRNGEVQSRINELFRRIGEDDMPGARELLTPLEDVLGSQDTEIIRARWLIENDERLDAASRETLVGG